MMRMRPGRSVRKMRPSGANSASPGICRSPTTVSTWAGVCASAVQPLQASALTATRATVVRNHHLRMCPPRDLRCRAGQESKLDLDLILRAENSKNRRWIKPKVGHQHLGSGRPGQLWSLQFQRRGEGHRLYHASDLEVPYNADGDLASFLVLRGEPLDARRRKLGDRKPGRLQPALLNGTVAPLAVRLKLADIHDDGPALAGPGVGAVNHDLTSHRPADPYRDVEAIILADQRLPHAISDLRLFGYNDKPLCGRGRSDSHGQVASGRHPNHDRAQRRRKPPHPHAHTSCSLHQPAVANSPHGIVRECCEEVVKASTCLRGALREGDAEADAGPLKRRTLNLDPAAYIGRALTHRPEPQVPREGVFKREADPVVANFQRHLAVIAAHAHINPPALV